MISDWSKYGSVILFIYIKLISFIKKYLLFRLLGVKHLFGNFISLAILFRNISVYAEFDENLTFIFKWGINNLIVINFAFSLKINKSYANPDLHSFELYFFYKQTTLWLIVLSKISELIM